MAETDDQRVRLYRESLRGPFSEEERVAILLAVQRSQLTGGAAFIDVIADRLGRRVEMRGQGRPPRNRK